MALPLFHKSPTPYPWLLKVGTPRLSKACQHQAVQHLQWLLKWTSLRDEVDQFEFFLETRCLKFPCVSPLSPYDSPLFVPFGGGRVFRISPD